MSHIVVGLSGGVDSAVAALLLCEQGHRVTAVFMKNWDEDDEAGYCPAEQDLADATQICQQLDIELKTVSFSTEYWDRVFRYFLDEYQAGRAVRVGGGEVEGDLGPEAVTQQDDLVQGFVFHDCLQIRNPAASTDTAMKHGIPVSPQIRPQEIPACCQPGMSDEL